ncbi:MAG: TIGR04282 family arsenosugar biosynthesis glycosyltransferase [Acidobacteria bacterium]|nr:TIGR04282 family arsenosugar biosynthesis glycosyltransferase [Acidobacteriota bacterium]
MRGHSAQPLVILFAKAPVAGRVKTRLLPVLTAQQAAKLHAALVADMLRMLGEMKSLVELELHTDAATEAWPEFAGPRRLQRAGGLGEKLLAAIDEGLARGYRSVLVLGSDSPGLPCSHVEELLCGETDVKLGPAEDGGYYGILARRTVAGMLDGVRWSTEHTMADTVASVERGGLSVSLGNSWFDVDEPGNLRRMRRVVEPGSATARWLGDADVQLRLADRLVWTAAEEERGEGPKDFGAGADAAHEGTTDL